jgi:hydroxyethylthiazole kinase-like uncharacterized protein yjeF
MDADALNAAARSKKVSRAPLRMSGPVVMTPHEGELARLLQCPTREISKDRVAAAKRCAIRYGVICVLKGRDTVITDGKRVFINPTGNPGMATGGSGDVLAGMMGALFARVREPQGLHAALAAVFLHGAAGDSAAEEKTELSMIAGDIIDHIPNAVKKLVKK